MTNLPEGLTPGTWNLDAAHSSAAFTVRHAGISKARGHFSELEGTLNVGQSLEDLRFDATLQTASITTGNEDRDNHLRSADFFDAANNPEIRFTTTAVSKDTITGDLTLHGVTKPVELDWEYEGAATDPFGTYRAGFSASTKISRKDFGLTWNAALEAGGVLVADAVTITIEAEFVAPAAA
ncbi:YceI family protein [Brachybacterium sp. JHP9]|uniref:YceI family protein n=1 Tax=Brachybacterium equifaecis TaxID=2910770 RepID=A0ABT0R1Q4_9MICO|nr:YceI family protein [Brachybacterium equifaecis]MCL6422860.1 YceI family protein [Brachybacterium equifaecis]